MENSITTIEKLIEKAEIYSKTSIELCKLEAVNKTVDVFSNMAVKIVLMSVVVMVILFGNIGLAFWIGQELEQVYYGFFTIAFVYLCFSILIYIFKKEFIKNPVSKFIINKLK